MGWISRWRASKRNEEGRALLAQGHLNEAEAIFKAVVEEAPDFEPAWFNLGLVYKGRRRWPESLRCNAEAARLRQKNEPALWNLGIAATALGDWATARKAWHEFGIQVPAGEGPIAMKLGLVPIRVNPDGEHAEVIWSVRIDPARAVINNVPFPSSGHRFGDLVLHDGEPAGTRVLRGQEVPVFNELQILEPSSHHTFVVRLEVESPEDVKDLVRRCASYEVKVPCEDWTSNTRMLCKACSEGRPHEHPAREGSKGWTSSRTMGFSCADAVTVDAILVAWKNGAPGRDCSDIEKAL
ncbi:MAG TPA: tetratricopeptide repeat protein [Planctomycetota bacterium]|nr:tetratricopeptide repeat protein [Planctomycetota bacterium]